MGQELGPNQRKFVDGLRSGEYPQGKGALLKDGLHCCLGVGCRILNVPGRLDAKGGFWTFGREENGGTAPDELQDLLALRGSTGCIGGNWLAHDGNLYPSLVSANDSEVPFTEIADFIEANPGSVFKEAR